MSEYDSETLPINHQKSKIQEENERLKKEQSIKQRAMAHDTQLLNKRIERARKMIEAGLSLRIAARITGVSEEDLK